MPFDHREVSVRYYYYRPSHSFSLRANMDCGIRSLRLHIDSEELVLPLEPDTTSIDKKLVEGEDIGRPREDFKFD